MSELGKVTLNAQQALQFMSGLEEIGGKAVDAVNQLCDAVGANNLVRSNVLQEMSRAIMREAMAFRCPVCHRTSYNRNDAENGFCGACHAYTGEKQL